MELKSSNYLQEPASFFHSHGRVKKDSDPMGKKDEAPFSQIRPGFSFTVGSRKSLPSKWDNAEKWVINCQDSPVNFMVKHGEKYKEKHKETEAFADESKGVKSSSVFQEPKIESFDHHNGSKNRAFSWVSLSEHSDLLLKDKFTTNFSKLKSSGVENRDTGTEMTPVGSSTVSRCPTPVKSVSPPRHNTPESRVLTQTQGLIGGGGGHLECDLANKLQPWMPIDGIESNWGSMEEEEEEISKSLRHFGMNNECLETENGPRASAWEEKEMLEPCLRYQIKEAKIQAWVNLQKAKAEAQSRKLEVKIQKMRSKHEEKMMKKMTIVHRKAEELRAAAQLDHSEMVAKSNKTPEHHHHHHQRNVQFSGHQGSCGCLISN